jgi:hypothetical protein
MPGRCLVGQSSQKTNVDIGLPFYLFFIEGSKVLYLRIVEQISKLTFLLASERFVLFQH